MYLHKQKYMTIITALQDWIYGINRISLPDTSHIRTKQIHTCIPSRDTWQQFWMGTEKKFKAVAIWGQTLLGSPACAKGAA
jgi:hypothetical protein